MGNLTAKQESFIKLMQKSEEHARKGFELLVARADADTYFDALVDAGLFDPKNNSGPIPADDPGYVRIPYWSALDYLEAVAKLASAKCDIQIAEKIMTVIRDVSRAQEQEGESSDNYHTWRKFAEIIGLVPTSVLTKTDIDLIPNWLKGRFDRGMVGLALDHGVMKKLLAGDSPDEWNMACQILNYCTEIRWEDEKHSGSRKKPVSVVDDYWLKKMIDHHSESYGIKTGKKAAQIFRNRVQEVFGEQTGTLPSYVIRPAVEENEQNKERHGPENSFVEGLREVLLAWVEHDISEHCDEPRSFVSQLLNDKNEMVRRIAIYVLGKRWHHLCGLYEGVVGPKLFSSKYIHEMYHLLQDRFGEFSEPYKVATLKAIRELPPPKDDEDSEGYLKYTQRNWLSAIAGKGYEPADTLYCVLTTDETIGKLSSHPDFHYYMETWSGSGPSPYNAQELLAYAEDGSLIEKLNEFIPSKDWRGPSVRSLVQALEEALGLNPKIFVRLLPEFHKANRAYQYGIISGFKSLWNAPESNKLVDWTTAWPKLFDFFEQLLNAAFWIEEVVKDMDLTPTRNWIPSAIAEFLKAGTKKDEHSFAAELLPRSYSIIDILLENAESVNEVSDDSMSQAINSEKGKAIEALFNHSLRTCRVSDQSQGNRLETWASLEPLFDREISKCRNGNYEFSTLAAAYLTNLEYMNHDWLEANFDSIFSAEFSANYQSAIDGLTYCSATRSTYAMLVSHGVLDRALRTDIRGRQARERIIERICLALLWGDEQLDSPRFSYLFDSKQINDLNDAIEFFWGVRRQDLSKEQIEIVMGFVEKCFVWAYGLSDIPKQLMSTLSRLICYVEDLTEKEMKLFMELATFVSVSNYADYFIEELNRLVEVYPSEVIKILGKMLEAYKPTFDYEDRLKNLLMKLSERGMKEDALIYANSLRNLPGFIELFKQLS